MQPMSTADRERFDELTRRLTSLRDDMIRTSEERSLLLFYAYHDRPVGKTMRHFAAELGMSAPRFDQLVRQGSAALLKLQSQFGEGECSTQTDEADGNG